MGKRKNESQKKSNKRASLRVALSNGYWVYKMLFKMSPGTMIVLIITTIVNSISPTISYYMFGRLIDKIAQIQFGGIDNVSDLIRNTDIPNYIMLYAGVLVANRFVSYIASYMDRKINHYYMQFFQLEIAGKISDLDVQRFEDPDTINTIKRAQDNTWKVYYFYKDSIKLFSRIITTIVTSTVIISIAPLLGLVTLLLSIPNMVIASLYMREVWNYLNETQEQRKKGWWLWGKLESTKQEEQYLTKANRFIYSIINEIWKTTFGTELDINKKNLRRESILLITVFLRYSLLPLYLISLVLTGNVSVGSFTFYLQQTVSLADNLDTVFSRIVGAWDITSYITFVRKAYSMKPAIKSGTIRLKGNNPPTIEFKDVWFKYPGSKSYVLKNVSFKIKPGDEIALVGENGAGKTTLIKLILRYYDCDKGEIFLNDIPIKDIKLADYHNLVGALFQEYKKYGEISVKENVFAGRPTSKLDSSKITKSLKLADAYTFVDKLPNKLNQVLDKSFEDGTNLSTGQWQKIALARMFYRDAPVLILDEPTAAIDANAEYRIFKRIFDTFKDKTVIIISHRFSTVRNAKKIYVLHDGRIVEEGSHKQLMAKKEGRYKKAFDLQAKGYTK